MTASSVRDRPGMRVVAGEPADPCRDRPIRLLTRLLASASDHRKPPIERAVRLARLSRLLTGVLVVTDPSREVRSDILHALRAEHDRLLQDEVLPLLREQGLTIVQWEQVSTAERNRLRSIFHEVIYPLATPLVLDSAHPFPQLGGVPLNIGVFLRAHPHQMERFACIPLPERLFGLGLLNGGFVRIGAGRLIGVEAVVCALIDGLFHGVEVFERASFRVIRGEPSVRSIGGAACSTTCLEVEETTSERMLKVLVRNLNVDSDGVYRGRAPLALAQRIVTISGARGRPAATTIASSSGLRGNY